MSSKTSKGGLKVERNYLIIDIDRCWGCRSCQVACKIEHNLTAEDFKPIEVIRVEQCIDSCIECDSVPLTCMHCDNAECIISCPQTAIYRDEEGIVRVDESKCIGCGICTTKCPYGAIGIKKDKEGKRKAVKCDMCTERRARGFMTSCEQHCIGGAITSSPESSLEKVLSPFSYRWSVGGTWYVSKKLSELGKAITEKDMKK